MATQHNIVGWFEIPVTKMDRAIKFYETVFNVKLKRQEMGSLIMAWFPSFEDAPGSPGSLVFESQYYKPSDEGVLIYFTTPSGNLDEDLEQVKKEGGRVLMPKKLITEDIGYMAIFIDSEGNRIALHSRA